MKEPCENCLVLPVCQNKELDLIINDCHLLKIYLKNYLDFHITPKFKIKIKMNHLKVDFYIKKEGKLFFLMVNTSNTIPTNAYFSLNLSFL